MFGGVIRCNRSYQEVEKKIIILGKVRPEANNKDHQNQEVVFGGGIGMTIKASCYKDVYKVVKKWKRKP